MVEHTLRTISATIPYEAVHASRGKRGRAEPIAALYEQCVAENTQIMTEHGNRAIQDIKQDDYIWTRQGLRKVLWSGQTGVVETLELRTANHRLNLTANHPVYVEGKGFVKALTLVPKTDIIKVCEIGKSIPVQIAGKKLENHVGDVGHVQPVSAGLRESPYVLSLCLMNGVIFNRPMVIGVLDAIQEIIYYIEIFGKQIMAQFQRGVLSIILTATREIIVNKTWRLCQQEFISKITMLANLLHNKSSGRRSAPTVVRTFKVASEMLDFVHVPVAANIGIKSIEPGPKLPVYNLEVEGSPEFFANGILVHNCKVFHTQPFELLEDQLCTFTSDSRSSPDRMDALVWALTALQQAQVGLRWL